MLKMPASISLANLPTRIEKLERLSKEQDVKFQETKSENLSFL